MSADGRGGLRDGELSMRTIEDLLACLEDRGAAPYEADFEAVTQLAHALQCAALAEAARAPPRLIAAALFHDLGHLLRPEVRDALARGSDDRHEELGADVLLAVLGPGIAGPVRLHVAAKRYLVATRTDYGDRLSEGSRRSLALQGGAMDTAERAAFEAEPFAREAVMLRLWDEAAKDPSALTPGLAHYRALLGPGADLRS